MHGPSQPACPLSSQLTAQPRCCADAADGPSTPEEEEFEDDDGTTYVWDPKVRKYVPKATAAPVLPYDEADMVFQADEEVIPTLQAALSSLAEPAAEQDVEHKDERKVSRAEARAAGGVHALAYQQQPACTLIPSGEAGRGEVLPTGFFPVCGRRGLPRMQALAPPAQTRRTRARQGQRRSRRRGAPRRCRPLRSGLTSRTTPACMSRGYLRTRAWTRLLRPLASAG